MVSGETQHIAFKEAGPSSTKECNCEGWALKTTKQAPQDGKESKGLPGPEIHQGTAGGQKADPVQVA